jgi:spoIIIJ-associated protein
MNKEDLRKIKEIVEDFFSKMTFNIFNLEVNPYSLEIEDILAEDSKKDEKELVNIFVKSKDPQILIGEKGQTLFEIQKLLRMIINKKFPNIFHLNLDINDYKKKKTDFLIKIAKESADEVVTSKKEKPMLPMSSYERRIIHSELSKRQDIKTESRGEDPDRYVVILPK